MMKSVLAMLVFVLCVTSVARAEDEKLNVTVSSAISSRYILQNVGFLNSDKPGVETDIAISKGHWTLDWWQRTDLSGGKYGRRGYGDEHDLTLTRVDQLGDYTLEVSGAYWMLTPLGTLNAHMFELYADVGRTFELNDDVSITPAVRLVENIGVHDIPSFTLVRYRMPIQVPVPTLKNVSIVVDPSFVMNFNPNYWINRWVFRPSASLVWSATESLILQFDTKWTNHTGAPEFDFGISYQF